jgi:hypothetical protein
VLPRSRPARVGAVTRVERSQRAGDAWKLGHQRDRGYVRGKRHRLCPTHRVCIRCLAQGLESTIRDVRSVVKVLLTLHSGITVQRGNCDRCRNLGPVVSLKT